MACNFSDQLSRVWLVNGHVSQEVATYTTFPFDAKFTPNFVKIDCTVSLAAEVQFLGCVPISRLPVQSDLDDLRLCVFHASFLLLGANDLRAVISAKTLGVCCTIALSDVRLITYSDQGKPPLT
jgi:hypothetical protein